MPKAAMPRGSPGIFSSVTAAPASLEPSLVRANERIAVTGGQISYHQNAAISSARTLRCTYLRQQQQQGGGDSEEWYPGCYQPTLDWAKKGPMTTASRSCRWGSCLVGPLLVSQKLLPTVSSPQQALRLLQLRAQTKTTPKPLPSVRTDLHGCSRIANIPVRFQVTELELERRMVEGSGAVCIDPSQPLDIGQRSGGSVGSGGLGAVAGGGGQSTWGTAPPSRLTHGTLTTPAQPRNLRSVDTHFIPSSIRPVHLDPTKPVKADL